MLNLNLSMKVMNPNLSMPLKLEATNIFSTTPESKLELGQFLSLAGWL